MMGETGRRLVEEVRGVMLLRQAIAALEAASRAHPDDDGPNLDPNLVPYLTDLASTWERNTADELWDALERAAMLPLQDGSPNGG